MSRLKSRQQRRAEKRRQRKEKNLFEVGLEALEIPTAVLKTGLTITEGLLYQILLLNSSRDTGRIHRAKIKQYMTWTGTKSRTSIYTALAGLAEKGIIEYEVDGWVKGTVLMRYQNKDTDQLELPLGVPLERALVHRQALKLMVAHRLPALAQRLYWKMASEIDLQTGEIHPCKVSELAAFFQVNKAAIYKAIRQINDAELGSLVVDYGIEGHLEHVALAYAIICLAVERIEEANVNGRNADEKFKRYKKALYDMFGVPIDVLSHAEVMKGMAEMKEKLDEFGLFQEPASWKELEQGILNAHAY